MILQPNIIIDELMEERISNNTLTIVDRIKLVLANFIAEFYPTNEVYINANQQNTALPCFFIDLYEFMKHKQLGETAKYEIGFSMSYVSLNILNDTELHNVIFKLQQHITDITDFPIQSVNGDVTDRIANLSGTIIVHEANIKTDPIIMKAEKELIQ